MRKTQPKRMKDQYTSASRTDITDRTEGLHTTVIRNCRCRIYAPEKQMLLKKVSHKHKRYLFCYVLCIRFSAVEADNQFLHSLGFDMMTVKGRDGRNRSFILFNKMYPVESTKYEADFSNLHKACRVSALNLFHLKNWAADQIFSLELHCNFWILIKRWRHTTRVHWKVPSDLPSTEYYLITQNLCTQCFFHKNFSVMRSDSCKMWLE